MKTPMKVSIKKQIIIGAISRMSITCKRIFWGEDCLWIFWQKSIVIFVAFIHIWRKDHISMYSLRKIIFYFTSKENKYYFSGKSNTIFPDSIRKIIFYYNFFENMLFRAVVVLVSFLQMLVDWEFYFLHQL